MTLSHSQHSLYRSVFFRSLTDDQLAVLHEASLEILARTGVRFYHQEALDLFKKAGADVSDGNLVRIPPHVVEWALRAVPKNITIYNRNGQRAMELGGYRSYFGVGSDCMHIYDLDTGERRRAVLDDVVTGIRLVDALPHLDFIMSMFLPEDVPQDKYERHQMAVMLRESTKPIVFVGNEAASTRYSVEMATAVAGGLESVQRYPFVINYINPTSAFRHNEEAMERLLYAAERNLPSIYAPGNSRGMTAPMTTAGAMALGNAGQLAGLVLSQLKREGSPFIRSGAGGGTLDMNSLTGSYAAPDGGPGGWEMAHYYGTPIFGTAGCSDAKIFDAQAATEAALSLFANAVGGANLIHDVGYLDCAMTGSLELVALCDEIIGWLRRYLRGLEINEETLALDLIHEVGPDGHFLDAEHTLRHVRESWRPKLFDRLDYHRWTADGSKTLEQRANQRVRDVLDSHRAEPLSADVLAAIQAVIDQ